MSRLRPEARPAVWEELAASQQGAIARVVALIADAVGRLENSKNSDQSHAINTEWVDADRMTRMAFLTGARGSGKSTMLMTLIHHMEHPSLISNAPTISRQIQLIQNRVVWLEPIDLEPAPADINFLVAILARIKSACDKSLDDYEPRLAMHRSKPRSPSRTSEKIERAYASLRSLQRDVAASWEGNLSARAQHLDVDTYAAEVMRLEELRLALNRRFGTALDDVARGFFNTHDQGLHSPLFVLPVDDFDLNPIHALSLLRYLRTISCPRLFTVLIGDLDILSLVSTLDMANRLFGLITDVNLRDISPIDPREISSVAAELATAGLRKLIPPSHRIALPRRTLRDGLMLTPLGSSDTDEPLHQLMHKFERPMALPLAGKISSLRDMLTAAVWPNEGQGPSDVFRVEPQSVDNPHDLFYSASELLRMGPRRTTDLWLELSAALRSRDEQDERSFRSHILATLATQTKGLLLEDPALSPYHRQAVSKVLSFPPQEVQLRDLPVSIGSGRETRRYEYSTELLTESLGGVTERPSDKFPSRAALEIRLRSLLVHATPRIEAEDDDSHRALRILQSDSASMLMLLNDYLATQRSGKGRSLIDGASVEGWAVAKWGPAVLEWPGWPVRTFWECDLAREILTAVMGYGRSKSAAGRDERYAAFSALWISMGWLKYEREEFPLRVDALAEKFHRRTDVAMGEGRGINEMDWLTDLALLSLPEYCVPEVVVNKMFFRPHNTALTLLWKSRINRVRARRLRGLVYLWRSNEAVVQYICSVPLKKEISFLSINAEEVQVAARSRRNVRFRI